jgi:signal transduction histidine kinase
VDVTFGSDGVTLRISDDGIGFVPAQAPGLSEGHFGLQGMRERVKRLGGTLKIQSEPGRGTGISAYVPSHALDPANER